MKLTEKFFSDDKTDEGMVQAKRPESMKEDKDKGREDDSYPL